METLIHCPLRYWRGLLTLLGHVLMGMVLLSGSLPSSAHEIPDDVKLVSQARVEGRQWVVMVRAPLAAMIEADIPLRGPYVDLKRAAPAIEVAARLWFVDRVRVLADGQPMPPPTLTHVRISLASDRSFENWDAAQRHLMIDPPETAEDLVWKQQYLDARLVFDLPSPQAQLAVDFDAARLGGRVTHTLRYQTAAGVQRVLQLHGSTGFVSLEPGPWESIRRFSLDGFIHILGGLDHLLFLACLMLGVSSLRSLVWTVTGFTLAHSLTLALAAMGFAAKAVWFEPLVEWAIAASIVLAAVDAVVWPGRSTRLWTACLFGLVHGLGFSFALRESLPFAGDHLTLALASFNMGVEAGQLLVLLIAWPVWTRLRSLPRAEIVQAVLGLAIAHTAWHWMSERWGALSKFVEAIDFTALAAEWLTSPGLWLLLTIAAAVSLARRGARRPR